MTELPPERQVAWRNLAEELLRLLQSRGTGLGITVDEIHAADRAELAQLAASVQHLIQDRLPIGLVFAGLPAAVSDLLNKGVATFLRRADKIDLHAATVRDVEASFTETFAAAAFNISPALVRQASEATGGYPFLIQLVGYFLWREAEKKQGHPRRAKDTGPSSTGDIGQRIGAKTNLVANYRTRLLAAGLIESAGYGKVDFAIPGLRRYLSSKPTD